MEQDNPKLQEFHKSLVDSNYEVPDYNTFEQTLKDPAKSKTFYDALVADKYEMPDYDTFVNTLGLKKKDLYETLGFGRDLVKEVFGEDYVKPSKEELEVSKKPPDSELPVLSEEVDFNKVKTPDLSLKKTDGKFSFPQNDFNDSLARAMLDVPVKKEDEPEAKPIDYITALPQGFNQRMGEAIRNIGAVANLPKEALAKGVQKIAGKVGSANEQYIRQAFSALPMLGSFDQESMDQLATAIEGAGNPGAIPNDLIGKTLGSTGSILFDIMAVRTPPTSKLNALTKYGMERVPMFPTYLATMGGATAARENKSLGETSMATLEGGASGLTYEGMGVAAGRVGQLVKELGGGQTLSTTSKALANSVLFGADSKAKGGSFLEGAAMGAVFGGYDLATEGINRSMAHRAYVSYLTSTENNIKTVSKMQVDPAKYRKQSDELWTQYEAIEVPKVSDADIKRTLKDSRTELSLLESLIMDKEGSAKDKVEYDRQRELLLKNPAEYWQERVDAYRKLTDKDSPEKGIDLDVAERALEVSKYLQKQHLLEEKTEVDNIININAMTQEILKNPKAFTDAIAKDERLSPKEKALWTNKINTTVKDADPRLAEAEPIVADIKNKEGELAYWQENESSDPMIKNAKIESVTTQIEEQNKALQNTLAKPLEDYAPKPDKKSGKAQEEEIVTTEKLSLGDKSFADKKELATYLEDVAIDKKSGEVDERWFDREVNSWPSPETVKAINEWTENKKTEIEAKKPKPKEEPVETGVIKTPPKELDKNDLIDEVRRFSILSASGKKKNALQANTIRVNAKRLGYELKEGDEWKVGIVKDGKFLAIRKDPAKPDKQKAESSKLLTERDKDFQDYMNDVLETNPNLFGVLIGGLANEQRAQAVRDIKAGKKSVASSTALDALEYMYKEYGGIDIWNAEGQSKVSISRDEIRAEVEDMKRRKRDELFNTYNLDEARDKGLITKTEYDEIRESDRKQDIESRAAEEDFYRNEVGDIESKKQEGTGIEEEIESLRPSESAKVIKEGWKVEDAAQNGYKLVYFEDVFFDSIKAESDKSAVDKATKSVYEIFDELGDRNVSNLSDKQLLESFVKTSEYSEVNINTARIGELYKRMLLLEIESRGLVDEYYKYLNKDKFALNEKPNEPNPPTGKAEGDNLSGGTEDNVKPVKAEGEAKPRTTDPVKQKQIEAIDKEYDAKIGNKQSELDAIPEQKKKALLEADARNGLFGDVKADANRDLIKPEEQGFKYNQETLDAIKLKYDERAKQLTNEIDAINKERESKIGEVLKQQSLDFGEPAKAEPKITDKELADLFPDDIVSVKLKDGTTQDMSFRGWDKGKAIVYNKKVGQFPVEKSDIIGVTKKTRPSEAPAEGISVLDLLGNPKEESMLTFDERAKIRFEGKVNILEADRTALRTQYQRELDRGYLKKFVEEGRITQADADAVLESAGLKAPEVKAEPTPQGIKFKDKTYTEVDQVLDALDKKEITFEESLQLREDVNNLNAPPAKKGGKSGKVEGFPSTPRAKGQKKLKTEPKTDNAEELAWDQPLPVSTTEDPNYKSSDLNNAMSLRNMGRGLVKNIGKTEGEQVRTGMIKRFMRRAAGIFNPQSGVIRVKNISDVRVLAHEIGHYIDQFAFDIRGVIGHRSKVEGDRFADVTAAVKIQGVKYKGRIYRTEDAINADVSKGRIKQPKANELIGKLIPQIKARDLRLIKLREKHGDEIVDGVMQRNEFKKELTGYLNYVGYPSDKRTEAIAEFVKDYVINPDQVKQVTPKFYAWFEKLIENAPEIKNALTQARADWNRYDAQDPRTKVLSLFAEVEKKPSFLDGIIKLDKDEILYSWVNHLQHMDQKLAAPWKKIVGSGYNTSKDPLISAKTMMGIDGRAQQWLLHHPYSRNGNDITIRKDIEGLVSVLKPIIGTAKDMDYSGYLLAMDSMESHRKGNPQKAVMSAELANKAIELWEKQYGRKDLLEFQGKIQKYNEALLDFYVETGKMSKETVELIKSQHEYYVPLKRVFDEYEIGGGRNLGSKEVLATSEKAVWSRHGSMKAVKYLYQSMIENTYQILAAGERNVLLTNVRDAFMDIQKYNRSKKIDTSIIEEIPPSQVKAYFDVETGEMRYTITKEKPKKGRILTIWDKGEAHYYDVAPEYYDPIFQQEAKVSELFRMMSLPSRWLQAGAVVYDPTFPIRNIFRDQQSAWFYSKHGYMPTDFVKGIASFIGKDEAYQKWLASGGDQSFLVSADQMMEKDYAKRKIGSTLNRKWETYKRNPLAAFQDLSRASEIGTRLGAFKNAYKKTNDIWKAAIESRDISADYGIHGARVRSALGLYPFLNARAQHARMTIETMKNPASFFMKGMAITAPALMNWLWNNQDEESRRLYQSLPAWRRVGMFNIRIPWTDHFLPIPKGFFGVMFGSSIESFMDSVVADDDRVAEELPKELFKQFSPVGNLTELVPFAIRPGIEMWANKQGYTGKPIISESMKKLKPPEQYYNSTPEIYKKIGDALNWSPIKINHYVKSYTGGAGMGAVNILDETLQAAGLVDKKPEDSFTMLSRMPVFKALLTVRPIGLQSGYVSDFYETLDKVEQLNSTFNNLVKTENYEKLDRLMADPDNQRMYSFYEGNSTAINNFRASLTWIRDAGYAVMKDDLLSMKEKQLEIRRMNDIVQETAIKFKEAYENEEFFDYGKGMDEIIEKMRDEKKDVRGDLKQQQNLYSPYWQMLRKDNKVIFDNIREFGGFKDIDQKVRITAAGFKSIDLSMEKSRLYNEKFIENYGKEVKRLLGETKDKYMSQQAKTPFSMDKEGTLLDQTFDMAWNNARVKTTQEFYVKKLYEE